LKQKASALSKSAGLLKTLDEDISFYAVNNILEENYNGSK